MVVEELQILAVDDDRFGQFGIEVGHRHLHLFCYFLDRFVAYWL